MRIQITTAAAKSQRADCLVLPIYSDGKISAATREVDRACGGLISELTAAGDMAGKLASSLLVHPQGAVAADRILLMGCGPRKTFDRAALRKALGSAYKALRRYGYGSASCFLTQDACKAADPYRRASLAAELWQHSAYRFTATKSKQSRQKDSGIELNSLALGFNAKKASAARRGLKHGDAIGQGMNLARELGNLPANVCTPSYLAKQARDLAKTSKKLRTEILDEAAMRKLGMGSLLSVTAGTQEPAKFIIMRYQGAAKKTKPLVLVGKGVTFDSGGISIKPSPMMDEMKFDMCGAATVFGVMQAITQLNLSRNLIGIVPAVENLPSGVATKPGDIVTAMSGETIEVLNTDAEGRLILADALTYAQRYKPAGMIDIATLTGACLIALGRHRSGLLSNTDRLADDLLKAGENADDPAWRLPLDDAYMRQLKSNFADVANVGGREAGTITAGCFLSRFVEDIPWAHLDIAGTAWRSGPAKGGTGRPVPLLMEYLLNG